MLNKPNIFLLSHILNQNTPGYGGVGGLKRTSLGKISEGHSSNSEEWTFKNHLSTHVDFPLHFFANGKSFSDYSPSDFYFTKTLLLDCPAEADEIITPKSFDSLPLEDCELLLLKTGFEQLRSVEAYWKHNPGLSPDLADFFRDRLPSLRAVGFDFISLTAYAHRSLGREAHKSFLGTNRELLIVEDMHLCDCSQARFSTLMAPFGVENADGTPVAVYGLF